jgi:hypothetical protein
MKFLLCWQGRRWLRRIDLKVISFSIEKKYKEEVFSIKYIVADKTIKQLI